MKQVEFRVVKITDDLMCASFGSPDYKNVIFNAWGLKRSDNSALLLLQGMIVARFADGDSFLEVVREL